MSRRRGHADGGSSVRVVLGESAQSRTLREILDGAGFELIGHASTPRDLLRLLAVTEPDVIVLDAEVSATAALSARDLAPLAGIVVVWPSAVSSSVADRQVTPTRAAFDLPDAVRRAKRPQEARAAALAVVPAAKEPAKVHHVQPRSLGPWRVRDHAFGLVAASFILAVAALGVVRTALGPEATRGESAAPTVNQPSPGIDGGQNQEPQEPTNVDQPEQRPLGPVVLLAHVETGPGVAPTHESKPPKETGGDEPGPDSRDHPPNAPQHHRRNPPDDGHPPDWAQDGGIGHAVHGAHGNGAHGNGAHGKPGGGKN